MKGGRITVLFLSILVTLAICELAVRVVSTHGLLLFDVEMWRYAKQIKQESSWPGIVEEHRTNADARLMGVLIRTDSHGFRRPDTSTESFRRSDDRIVVALGDSLTLGWGAPQGKTYADYLERILNERARQYDMKRVTVFNAGIGNSNTSMQLARYKRDIRPLRPEWLILGFFINDAELDPVPNRNILVRHSALAALMLGQVKIWTGPTYQNYEEYYKGLYRDDNPGWTRLQQALGELGELLRQDNVQATIILFPEMHQPKDFGPFAEIYQQVGSIARESGFEVIDASLDFPAGQGNRYWVTPTDAHPNAEAHEIFAGALESSRSSYSMIKPESVDTDRPVH